MRFELSIECDNAAFDDDMRAEVARLLVDAGGRVWACSLGGVLRDRNGNVVGEFRLSKD